MTSALVSIWASKYCFWNLYPSKSFFWAFKPHHNRKSYKNKLSEGCYTGPFSKSHLEYLIGPFQSSPLGVVPKAGSPREFHIIQDLSFLWDGNIPSVNSSIYPNKFPCEWGTFSKILILVMDAPPGTHAATLDAATAFQWPPPNKIPLLLCGMEDILLSVVLHSVLPVLQVSLATSQMHWSPCTRLEVGLQSRSGSTTSFSFTTLTSKEVVHHPIATLDNIYLLMEPLGWPWKLSKTRPFTNTFLYLGFYWNITEQMVAVPENKCTKFIEKLATWLLGHKVSHILLPHSKSYIFHL